jgi:uncharacterized membrane protein
MNDITTQPQAGSDARLDGLRTLTLVTYVLYAVSALVGITAIVAIIINYIKRDETRGTIYESHFSWQIRTFWWGLLWSVLGFLTIWVLGLGFVVLVVNSIWLIYRVVRGFLNWNDGKAMPV